MGNRAVITTAPFATSNVGIYVHWNGGQASIEGFLKAARELGYRSPDQDKSYGIAGLAGLIWSFLGTDGMSVGIDRCAQLDCDNGDNGVYLIGKDWQIVGRVCAESEAWANEIDQQKTDAIAADIIAKVKAASEAKAPEVLA